MLQGAPGLAGKPNANTSMGRQAKVSSLSRGWQAFFLLTAALGLLGIPWQEQVYKEQCKGLLKQQDGKVETWTGVGALENSKKMEATPEGTQQKQPSDHLAFLALPPCHIRLQVSYDTYHLVLVTAAGVHCLLATKKKKKKNLLRIACVLSPSQCTD